MTHEELREKVAGWFAHKDHHDEEQGPCEQCYRMADSILALVEPMLAEAFVAGAVAVRLYLPRGIDWTEWVEAETARRYKVKGELCCCERHVVAGRCLECPVHGILPPGTKAKGENNEAT
jgi:hypothetical protein